MEHSEHSGFTQVEDGVIWKFLFRSRRLISLIASGVLVVAMVNFVWAYWQAPAKVVKQQGVWANIDSSRYLLRLSGSGTIGSVLAPQLVTAWLTSIGALDVEVTQRLERNNGGISEKLVRARLNGNPIMVELKVHDSASAFTDLASGAADIGMSSREINSSEVTRLMSLGYMRSAASEHFLGVESIAVIVPKSNAISSISLSALKKIFSGEITNWSAIGMRSQPIHLYTPNNNSGLYRSFVSLLLGDVRMANAKRYQQSEKLDTDVANDPGAIGFIGAPDVKDTRTVSINNGNDAGHLPISENYTLTRRLYLYTAAVPENTSVTDFVRFANSSQGENIVRENRFALTPEEDLDVSNDPTNKEQPQPGEVKTSVTEVSATRSLPAYTSPMLSAPPRDNIRASVTEASVIRSLPASPPAMLPPPVVAVPQAAIAYTETRPTPTSDTAPQSAPAPIPKAALPPPSLQAATPVPPPVAKIAPPPAPPPPVPPVAITSHAVAADDYPLASIHLLEQGNVVIKYLVNQDGSVGGCNVITSSGKSRLDDGACAMVKRHWKFKPAMQDGKPVAEFLTAEVIFQLNDQAVKGSRTPLDGLKSLISRLL